LLKAGMACEELGRYDNAATYFEKIKKEYPTSSLAREVDQHIARVKGEIDK
ncbi:MAG: hypothetical protein CSA04_04925, partial [Bacteroidetes bacterium]